MCIEDWDGNGEHNTSRTHYLHGWYDRNAARENGYTPVAGWMEEQLRSRYAFQDPHAPPRTTPPSKNGVRISYDIVEYDPLLDSANMETRHWVQIAHDIQRYYDEYDGFWFCMEPIRWHIPLQHCHLCW